MHANFADVPDALWRRIAPLIPPRKTHPARPPACSGSHGDGWHPLSPENRLPVESAAVSVWFRFDLPSAHAGVDASRCLRGDLRRASALLRSPARRSLAVGVARQRHGEGAKRGIHTGPNPTDRAKLGVKRHIVTDARGVPLSAIITAANVHDKWLVATALDALALRGPRGPRRPRNLCLDKGYDYSDAEAAVRHRRIVPHIRRRGENALLGCVRGKPRRWVVERTNSWHNRFRALLIRWERKAENYLAMLHLASGLIALRMATA